jgi:hypothetical protein
VDVGVFFFDADYANAYRWRRRLAARQGTVALSFDNVLGPGAHEYSIEAHDPAANTIARARGAVTGHIWPVDSLALSDLLIADRILSLGEPPAASRDDLRIRGRADLTFRLDEGVGLYWEVYGLSALSGIARYRVSLDVQDAERRSLPVRVVRAIADVLGGGQKDPRLTWEREVAVENRDRAIDWILLDQLPEGEHRIVVTVEDLNSLAMASTSRTVNVRPAPRD